LEAWGHNARWPYIGGHTFNRHVRKIAGKSNFCKPSALPNLIRRTLKNPDRVTLQGNGNTKYTKNFGRQIGQSRCGDPVSGIVVIRKPNGKLVTAWPE
jgi:hypothetical protein